MTQFRDFELAEPLYLALEDMGFETPTPIQGKAIPLVLEGRDVLATAQTGTGKTAAFALPLISKMLNGWKKSALIIAPTRELAEQIGSVLVELTAHTPELRTAVVIGGSSYPRQIRALRNQPSFVVGTPGRLIDQGRLGHLRMEDFGALVIDEADRLLDMGFEPQMTELIDHLPKERQGLLFSATLPEEIMRFASRYLSSPVRVAVGAVSKPIDKIRQDIIRTTTSAKDQLLVQEIDKVAGSVIIFVKTKFKTEKLAKFLLGVGHEVTRIHGDRTQQQRSTAIADFRSGAARILVATDIAARGIDIPHIQHVINYDLPMAPEDYIHRIGRTARAGAEGHSIAFVTPEENIRWAQIHKLIYGKYPDEFPRRGGGLSGRQEKPRTAARGGTRSSSRAADQKSDRRTSGDQRFNHQPSDRADDRRPRRSREDGPSRGASGRRPPQSEERGPSQQIKVRHESYGKAPRKPTVRGGFSAGGDPKKKEHHVLSPRRQAELIAEKFLKDERRKERRPQDKNSR